MYQRILIVAVLVIVVMACTNKSGNKMPDRKPLPVTAVIADSLFTSFPGTLQVTSKHLALLCPYDSKEKFLVIYDRQNGEQIARIGSIGKGPGEWLTPQLGNVIDDNLVIYDLNTNHYLLAGADNMYQDISNPDSLKMLDKNPVKFIYVDHHRNILASFREKYPFEMTSKEHITSYGKYPFEEDVVNTFDLFQGPILMHPQKEIMIYATISNPYLAMYRIGDDGLDLIWENQFKPAEYRINNQQLEWGSNQHAGISEIVFTKDYIVCLIKDFKSEAKGRDIKAAPKSVYLFDYEGRLTHIFDLPYHTVRLAADAQSNTFYAVSLEPDYSIVKYDLTTVGL